MFSSQISLRVFSSESKGHSKVSTGLWYLLGPNSPKDPGVGWPSISQKKLVEVYCNGACQIKIGFLLTALMGLSLYSCAKPEVSVNNYEIPEPNKNAKWFLAAKRFSPRDLHGNVPLHPFFDYAHNANMQQTTINFVMTTPVNNDYGYGFDLLSGKTYRRFEYCPQGDIWGKFDSGVYRPNFNDGFVPRMLDQLGKPQRMIVFGNSEYFSSYNKVQPNLDRVRVVGGVVEQYCKSFPCTTRDKWLSRLVLVGVKPEDPQFAKIRTLTSLKKVVDWGYVKAFLENSSGRTFEGDKELPAYRIVGGSGPKNALNFALNNGYLFDDKAIGSMKSSCHKLYDFIWESVLDIRQHHKQKTERVEKPKINKNIGRFRQVDIRKKKKSRGSEVEGIKRSFAVFMNVFYKNYVNRYQTCQKYVRSTNLNNNPDRHWFFAFLEAFVKLEETGYVYKCNRQAWIENPLLSSGKRMFSVKDERRRCTVKELDRAFDMTSTVFSGLQRSNNEHYQYIQYDEGRGGSHQKLYSWVYHNGKRLACFKDNSTDLRAEDKLIFPNDINWRPFSDTSRKGIFDIIR